VTGDQSQSLILLSAYHAYSAEYFLSLVVELEDKSQDLFESEPLYRHRALVMATILSSVAYLEARINEVFEEASREAVSQWPSFLCAGLTHRECKELSQVWDDKAARRSPPLEKYRLALTATGRSLIKETLHENAVLLLKLRNHLVHFDGKPTRVPNWDEGPLPQGKQTQLERSLRGKFELCTLSGRDFFFPDQCLGSGCAEWALKSACDFVTAFSDRLGLVKPFWPTPAHDQAEDNKR
jgi:hypothetical protein